MKVPQALDRRFEGVVLVGDTTCRSDNTPGDVSGLLASGMTVAIMTSLPATKLMERFGGASAGAGALLASARDGREVGFINGTGLVGGDMARATDFAERDGRADLAAAQWILDELWRRGIGAENVLVLLEELVDPDRGLARFFAAESSRVTLVWAGRAERGLPAEMLRIEDGRSAGAYLLRDQLARRQKRQVPAPSGEPGWRLAIEGFDSDRERVREALLTLSDGRIGVSGAPLAGRDGIGRWVLASGVYQGEGPETHLLTGPPPIALPAEIDDSVPLRRNLDLRSGLLHEEIAGSSGRIESVRFACLTRPGTFVVRLQYSGQEAPEASFSPPQDDPPFDQGVDDGALWMRVAASSGGIAAAAVDDPLVGRDMTVVDRVVHYTTDPETLPSASDAVEEARRLSEAGFDRLVAEHRRAWASRWEDGDVAIEGDDDLQLAVRFGLFHLMASTADGGEAAVGARGLTGTSYRGHVFWDTDTYVLPFLAATHPEAARAILEYRVRRLPAALDAARAIGRAGARFPWESARTGEDVTPLSARDRTGRVVPIRTGQLEDHIVAEVAWASCCYVDWTGDDAFARGPGLRLLVETARYWASRVRLGADGAAHIYGVIGPDEYHEPVDDNAFTNVMARWNLKRAAAAVRHAGTDSGGALPGEPERWDQIATSLLDGYDPDTGLYEQFAGYWKLEPLIIEEVAPRRPIAADLLLGADRVRQSQVLKQADVLMLHHLIPDEMAPDSLEPNLRFYEPRTAHGSSLSPGVHAALLARTRDFPRALTALQVAARMDLDDLTGSTPGGLHLATMGGVWQALVFGFGGVRPGASGLQIDPRLPPSWSALDFRVRYRGSRVRVRKERGRLFVQANPAATLLVSGSAFTAPPEGLAFERRRGPTWEPVS